MSDKKKVNGRGVGQRGERFAVQLLIQRFGPGFSRSVGSGNRWGQVSNLPAHAMETYAGDITCPANFLWIFECKTGYAGIDFSRVVSGGNKQLDSFIEQVSSDAVRSGRKPVLLLKQSRKDTIAFVRATDVALRPPRHMVYGDWIAMSCDDFLKQPDAVFFADRT